VQAENSEKKKLQTGISPLPFDIAVSYDCKSTYSHCGLFLGYNPGGLAMASMAL
jgi:hypothetical protein